MTTAEMPNVCDECTAGHALSAYRDKLNQQSEQTSRAALQRADAESAIVALNTAAGQIACQDLNGKKLPALREDVDELGKIRLIWYVSKCPAFRPSLKLRLEERGVSSDEIESIEAELEN